MSNSNPTQTRGSTSADIESGHRPHEEKDDSPQSSDDEIVDWDSPTDPQNPRNWPGWKKNMHIFLLGILTLNA
jgi:hypothetical protein